MPPVRGNNTNNKIGKNIKQRVWRCWISLNKGGMRASWKKGNKYGEPYNYLRLLPWNSSQHRRGSRGAGHTLNWWDRDSNLGRKSKLQYTDQRNRGEKVRKKRILKMCTGFSLTTQHQQLVHVQQNIIWN